MTYVIRVYGKPANISTWTFTPPAEGSIQFNPAIRVAVYPWGSVGELPCATHQPSPGVTPDPPRGTRASHPNELYSCGAAPGSRHRMPGGCSFVQSPRFGRLRFTCVGCGCGCQTPPDPSRKCLSNPCRAMTPMNGRPWKGGKGREFRYNTVSNPCESPYEG
jgi:hypothetical protein